MTNKTDTEYLSGEELDAAVAFAQGATVRNGIPADQKVIAQLNAPFTLFELVQYSTGAWVIHPIHVLSTGQHYNDPDTGSVANVFLLYEEAEHEMKARNVGLIGELPYSQDWNLAKPIIDKHDIKCYLASSVGIGSGYIAYTVSPAGDVHQATGDTRLVAMMRSYVACALEFDPEPLNLGSKT